MKNWGKNVFVFFMLIVILAFIGCNNNGDNDPKCSCPNGTVHTDVQCVCNAVGYNCNCTYEPIIPDPKCTCPNGTLHTDAPCDCDAEEYDCNCTYQYTQTINFNFGGLGGVCTALVKGTLMSSQWDGLTNRIEVTIQKIFDIGDFMQKLYLADVFSSGITVIVVEKDAVFNQWLVSNRFLVHLDFDYLNGQSDETLTTSLFDMIVEMSDAPVSSP